jgi:hypothetical protein
MLNKIAHASVGAFLVGSTAFTPAYASKSNNLSDIASLADSLHNVTHKLQLPGREIQKDSSCGNGEFSNKEFLAAYPGRNIIAPDINQIRLDAIDKSGIERDNYIEGRIYDDMSKNIRSSIGDVAEENKETFEEVIDEEAVYNTYGFIHGLNHEVHSKGVNRIEFVSNEEQYIPISIQQYGSNNDSNDRLGNVTGWEKGSYELTEVIIDGEKEKCGVAHHEVGHAVHRMGGYEKTGSIPSYESNQYSAFVSENIADVNRVLQMAKAGVDKDKYIDLLSMRRAYEAINTNGGDHFSVSSIQEAKNISRNKINSMSENELAEFAISFVQNGDEELGISRPIDTEKEFYEREKSLNKDKTDDSHQNLKQKLQSASAKYFNTEGKHTIPTPLETEYILKNSPEYFTELEKKFLEDNIISYADMVVTAMDAEHGLTDDPKATALMEKNNKLNSSYEIAENIVNDAALDMITESLSEIDDGIDILAINNDNEIEK